MKNMGVVVVELLREDKRIYSKLRAESILTNSFPFGSVLPIKFDNAIVSLSGLRHLSTRSF